MARDSDLNAPDLRARAVKAARGHAPFDLLVEGGTLLDVVTGALRAADIGIVGGLIASVHAPDPTRAALSRVDAAGCHLVPGLIDTHMHVESSMITPAEYARAVLPRGVTTAVWDPHEFANACGVAGVEYAIAAGRETALRFLTLAPTCVPSAPGFEFSGGDFGPAEVRALLARDDIHGAAELMTMHPLLAGDDRVRGIVNAGLQSGKRVCGHARGLEGADLAAYAAAGVETDHELTSGKDLKARLEAGMTVELRGSHGHLLPEFAAVLREIGHLPQTLTFCTDDVFPDDLHKHGGLDHMVRRMIGHGLPVDWAYRAATLNAATRLGRPDLGVIGPGKRADLVLLDDLTGVGARAVIADGTYLEASELRPETTARAAIPPALRKSVDVPALAPSDFDIASAGANVRIATLSKPRFPEWGERRLTTRDGVVVLPGDMIRMAVINRYGRNTPPKVALLENWGAWRGAFATTVSHDSHNLTVFGRSPTDMALAANAVRQVDGGLCVVADGEIKAQLALPVAGLVSEGALDVVSAQFAALRDALDELVTWEPPYLVFKALFGASLVCNAGPRLSDVGLVDVFADQRLDSPLLS